MKPLIYDRNMNLVSMLQDASKIGYKRVHNDLYTASFSLPVLSNENEYCDTHYIIDVFDGDISKGKYRILDEPETIINENGSFIRYDCEHVISFLLNSAIHGFLEIGGTGVYTKDVINHLLSLQAVQRWKLGKCDFNHQFQYSWENTNVLEALFSVAKCFDEAYHWTYDTSSYPWTLNLVKQDTNRGCEIRRKRNMQTIRRSKDSSALCTRLYCLGNGEGVNQVNIKSVNPTGKAYLDADTIGKYGVLESHFIDLTITDPATLMANASSVLEEIKEPRYTYTAKAADLNRITGDEWDLFDEGKYVHLVDESIGADLDTIIVSVEKEDVDADPLDIEITISNKPSDVAGEIENLARRTAITAQYSQGATNLYVQQFADNADKDHPAELRFYIPENCAKINRLFVSWKFEHFRAYERGAASGGGSTETSSEGWSQTGPPSPVFSSPNNQSISVSSGGGGSTGASGGHSHAVTGSSASYVNDHRHSVPSHTHDINGTHQHNFIHTHDLGGHKHTVRIPAHTHGIIYGIYSGDIATSAVIKIDGQEVPSSAVTNEDFDIIPYLSKDGNGKIIRNTWHTVEIVPNKMTRIEANMFVQTFITSYIGGNY